jgi:hypothetical protein
MSARRDSRIDDSLVQQMSTQVDTPILERNEIIRIRQSGERSELYDRAKEDPNHRNQPVLLVTIDSRIR